MGIKEKEEELNKYLNEWVSSKYEEWLSFKTDVNSSKRSGIYSLKKGPELLDFLNSLMDNIEEHLMTDAPSSHIIPSKFSSIEQFLCFLRNFQKYVDENYPLLECNIKGEDTSYIVVDMIKMVTDIRFMAERCLNIYVREEHIPEPYVLMRTYLACGQVEKFMEILGSVIKSIPYMLRKTELNESHFHIMVHAITAVLGFKPLSEQITSDGRIDLSINMPGIFYIFEFKYTDNDDSYADDALQQIKVKKYADANKHLLCDIIGVGVSFSSKVKEINGHKTEVLWESPQ